MSITNDDLTIFKDFLFKDKNTLSQFQYDNFHQFMEFKNLISDAIIP